jgi:hypothetical protein
VRESVDARGRVLGERAQPDAEHLVSNAELGHAGAERLDGSGDVLASDTLFRTLEP